MMNALERMKKFHQAKWNEPIIYEISEPGQRAVLVPGACCDCVSVEEAVSALPEGMVRKDKPNLPEIAQLQLVRHYNHLSQENIGIDGNIDIGQGTCTMKYNPKVNDRLAGLAKITDTFFILFPFDYTFRLCIILSYISIVYEPGAADC